MIAAVAATSIALLSGGSTYTVKAIFQNSSQPVKGNLVQVAGSRSARSRTWR